MTFMVQPMSKITPYIHLPFPWYHSVQYNTLVTPKNLNKLLVRILLLFFAKQKHT
jgi:hypothetical protein